MRKLYPLFILLFFTLSSQAQVRTEPALPQQDQPLSIYYDASQGTSALEGAEKVYMHAGVITSGPNDTGWEYVVGNWGQDDGVGLMEKVEGEQNLWKITIPSPREYFNVPESETIYRIGMVFRNANGTKEGKSDANTDIFVDVFQGFAVTITQPAERTIFVERGQQLTLEASASVPSTIVVSRNGQEVNTYPNTATITESFTFASPESQERIIVSASNGNSSSADTLDVLYSVPSPVVSMPVSLEQGLNRTGTGELSLVLLAPGKESVYVVGDFTNWRVDPDYLMNRDGDYFWLPITGLDPAKEYAFYYLVDETIKIADPFSEKVLDAGNDSYISEERYPGLRPFPAEAATDRLTAFTVEEEEYVWQAEGYTRPKKEDLIIYELLVRDFSAEESLQGVIDRLDYLDSLHITAIQLLPVMEFNGNDSWGYNPTFMTALDKWYGTEEKLKELIDKAHQRGIAVILDITLNHQDYPNPFLKMWWAGSTASADNPFFNPSPTHPFNVFTDLNHESLYTQAYLDQVVRYWLEEYRVDGFRFDLSKGFTQTESGGDVAAWSAYDASRIAILKRMADEIREIDPEAILILEHFADNEEEKELADYGFLLWGNLNHNYGEAIMGYNLDKQESSFDWLSYQERGWNEPNVVGYIESHDEERLVFKALEYGNSSGDYTTQELATALDRIKLAAAFFIPVPGPKMIWQFGELGYDISIEENGRTGKKPLKWEYLEEPERQNLFRTFSALNFLKTEYPVFETEDYEISGTGAIRTLKLNGPEMNVLIVGNFGLTPESASVNFQHGGRWYSYFNKDSLEVAEGATPLALAPGEFRLYFDQALFYRGEGPNPLGLEESQFARQIQVYPNPARESITILTASLAVEQLNIRLLDQLGRLVYQQSLTGSKTEHSLSLAGLRPGLYLLEVSSRKEKAVKRIVLY